VEYDFVSAEGTDITSSCWSVKDSQEMLAGAWRRMLHKRQSPITTELAREAKMKRIHITLKESRIMWQSISVSFESTQRSTTNKLHLTKNELLVLHSGHSQSLI